MIGLLSRKYLTQTRGSIESSILYGCIGEKINVKSVIYFEQATILSGDNKGYFNPDPSISGKVYNADLWYVEDGNFFNECKVGDTIVFRSQTFPTDVEVSDVIVEIISGGIARMSNTYTNRLLDGGAIYNSTDMKSVIYQYGLGIGGFNSLVDGSLQKFILNSTIKVSLISITPALSVGLKDWQFKTTELQVSGNGNTPSYASQSIIINHEFVVGPLFLTGQYGSLLNGTPPDYFKSDNDIKYSSQIEYQKNAYIVNDANVLPIEGVGQFGWFNTKFDGTIPPYALTALSFKRIDLSIANQLEYVPIEVKFRINSSTNNFSAVNTALVLGFNYLPSDETFYQNTDRTIETNFSFDSKKLIANNVVVNGEKFGTSLQIIKNIKAQVISTSILEITANIEIGSGQLPILLQGDIAQYALWCIIEDTSTIPELSDKTNVLVDVNYIYVQKTKIDLFDANNVFIEHPYENTINGKPTLQMFPVDDVVANTLFTLDYTGLEDDNIIIKSVTPQIVLKHSTEADIVLDSYFISTENYNTVGSLPAVQDIDFIGDRPYKIEDGIRKTITFQREYTSDIGNVRAWVLSFPFMNRWEYWLKIAGLNEIPESIFDSTLPFKGSNHFWNRLINSIGWTCVYRVSFDLEQNGENFEQSFDYPLTSTDFNSNPDWSNCEIKSFDIATNTEIVSGPKKYVYSNQSQKDTLIEAKFTKYTGVVPDILNVAMVLWCESFEGGGITEIKRISSVYDVNSLSCWKGVGLLKKVEITKNINTFTGKAILDYTKIPQGQKVTVYARIYEVENTDIPDGGRITSDNILRQTSDDYIRVVN